MEESNKMNMKKICAMAGIFMALSILVGCAGAQNPTATTDPKLIYTQVAETVQAQITNTAKLTPHPTNTPLPTDVPPATATLGIPIATTVANGTAAATTAAGTPGVVNTNAPGTAVATTSGQVPAAPDKMLYVSQAVKDGTKFNAGDQFTMSWTIQNVGTTTWDTTYTVRLYGGDRFGVKDFNIPSTVKPQQTVKLSAEMTAPSNAGQYTGIWVLTNTTGVNFGYFTFALEVK